MPIHDYDLFSTDLQDPATAWPALFPYSVMVEGVPDPAKLNYVKDVQKIAGAEPGFSDLHPEAGPHIGSVLYDMGAQNWQVRHVAVWRAMLLISVTKEFADRRLTGFNIWNATVKPAFRDLSDKSPRGFAGFLAIGYDDIKNFSASKRCSATEKLVLDDVALGIERVILNYEGAPASARRSRKQI